MQEWQIKITNKIKTMLNKFFYLLACVIGLDSLVS